MKRGIAILLMLLSMVALQGQEKNKTFSFRDILFKDLADSLEKKFEVRIYYSDKWVDTLHLDVTARNDSVEALLSRTLMKEGFSFIVTGDRKIILSRGFKIKTNFRDQYSEYLRQSQVKTDSSAYIRPVKLQENVPVNEEYRVFRIGKPSEGGKSERATLSGTILEPVSGIPVAGAVVYIAKIKAGAVTNTSGYYSISLPRGQYQMECRMVGMRTTTRNFVIYSDGLLDVDMTENTNQLNEVVVSANKENNVRNVRIGVERLSVKMLRQIPMGLGESDLVKSSLLLPGVQTVGEASGGFNVRGGSADQNLILLNEAPIINPSHFFGFFSTFNSDLITEATLYKSCIPAKFGGRVSSVMDIQTYEGNSEKIKVSGGVNPVTGRILVDGPLKKGKSTFAIGSRATYSDWILKMLPDEQLKKSTAGFYDLQGIFSSAINEKNSISLSGYYSRDKFDYYRESAFNYGNLASTLRWKHTFGTHLSAQFSAILSNYNYTLESKKDSVDFKSMYYELTQKILRADFLWFAGDKHKVEYGFDGTYYSLMPGDQKPLGDFSLVSPKKLERERAVEPSLYINDEYEVNPNISLSGGIRTTLFTAFGPGTEYIYASDSPRDISTITDTISYGRGRIMKSYPEAEFRFSSRFILSPSLSVKAGVQRMYQYLHMISNTVSISPTDVWKLSDRYIKPAMGDQVSIGIYNNFGKRAVETSVEAYYKVLTNILDYKGGAQLLMNEHLETDIINAKGKAYGIELMAKKQAGSLTGWVSYTYSRTMIKVDSKFSSEKVNGGNYFPANYDKPHDLKIVTNYKFSRRLNASSIFVYNTGRPITYPVSFFYFNNTSNLYYSNRNEYRIPDYMRLDLAATLNGNLKVRKLNHSSFTFTCYNVLGRRNPYSVFFREEDGIIKGYQMSIFGNPIFMITYNFKILGNASNDF